MPREVLVVEDHQDICNLLALHLRDMDCNVTTARDGTGGMTYAKKNAYDLIVLDWMLPGISGIEICREVRRQESYTPILLLTAKSMVQDRVKGLDAGADDYVTKPFSVPEFRARVRAVFRRVESSHETAEAHQKKSILQIKELSLDSDRREVFLNTHLIALTAKEFDLLLHLARHPGQVFSRQQLLDTVWGSGFDGFEHTVNSHINRLRAKIEQDPAAPEYIVTMWGVGYKLNDFRFH